MPERRTIVLDCLLALILVASIFWFIGREYLGHEVSSVNRGIRSAQQQIRELNQAGAATFEQTMRRFDALGRQLDAIASPSKNASAAKTPSERVSGSQTATTTSGAPSLNRTDRTREQSTLQTR